MRQLLATLRHRPAPLIGIFIALVAAASTVTWAFSLGHSGGASQLPAQRLAGAAVDVTGQQNVTFTYGHGKSATSTHPTLTSYRRVPASLTATVAAVPGVQAAVADKSIPLALKLPTGRVVTGTSDEPVTGYGWQSAELTPFALRSGHAPAGPDQLVIGAGLAKRTGNATRLMPGPGRARRQRPPPIPAKYSFTQRPAREGRTAIQGQGLDSAGDAG